MDKCPSCGRPAYVRSAFVDCDTPSCPNFIEKMDISRDFNLGLLLEETEPQPKVTRDNGRPDEDTIRKQSEILWKIMMPKPFEAQRLLEELLKKPPAEPIQRKDVQEPLLLQLADVVGPWPIPTLGSDSPAGGVRFMGNVPLF
jgi:hypothetical protein